MPTLYEEMVEAIDGVSGGPHPGHRAAHARGSMCKGTFVATPRAAELSRARHLSGQPVPVTARFSNGSGNPSLPDNLRTEGRGLAVKFHLDGDESVDSVTISIPVFFVRTPEDFLEFTRARKPDPETGQPDPEKLGALLAEHPETGAALQLILPSLVPPASYATCGYNSLHAFCLVNADDDGTWVKLRWEPEAGVQTLPEEEIEAAADDYLQSELRGRLERGPIRFRLVGSIGTDADPLEDPTLPWPDEREKVELGTLELTEALPPEKPGELNVFDPMNLVDGIVPSADRILHARTHAYSVSIDRRLAASQ